MLKFKLSLSFTVTTLFLAILLPDVLFPHPMPFFRHSPFRCCPLPPSSSRGVGFFPLLPQSTAAQFHSAVKAQSLCNGEASAVRKASLPLPALSILTQQETTKQPFRDRTSPTMLLFGISPCLSVQTTETVPSQCQALSLQLKYGF